MDDTHDELLAAAVQAHCDYEDGIERLKRDRSAAFRRALNGSVTAVELAKELGISNTHIARIARGKY